jgi:hypothetical protein
MNQNMLFALSLGFAGVILATHAAFAAPQCGPRDAVMAALADKYRETRRAMGLAANQAVIEVFASDDSGSWTITATLPEGQTCLVASGHGYETMTDALPPEGNPT